MRETHPVVGALLAWRKAERVATTYGYAWLDEHLDADGRLARRVVGLRRRGRAHDRVGRAAQHAGRHARRRRRRSRARLRARRPRTDRTARARGRLGRRRAARGDDRPTTCTRRSPHAARRRPRDGEGRGARRDVRPDHRPRRAGAPRPRRCVPGGDGVPARGRPRRAAGRFAAHLRRPAGPHGIRADDDELERARRACRAAAARGRYGRNAMVQGAAAELFKAWAVTVRARAASLDARIVLCLHDELLVHAPAEHADAVARLSTTACRRPRTAGHPTTPSASSPTSASSPAGPTPRSEPESVGVVPGCETRPVTAPLSTTATVDDHLAALRTLVGPHAEFRDGQRVAIEALVDEHRRVLCVQRTGWGKSAVYFVATMLLRDAGQGPDPARLAAARADAQPDRAGRRGRHPRRHDQQRQQGHVGARSPPTLADDRIDILLVSPERFANAEFRDRRAARRSRPGSACS